MVVVLILNGQTLWEEGFLFCECAWASRRNIALQAIGDRLVRLQIN
jgi:hypothetical protein